jgi:protein SCO1/2
MDTVKQHTIIPSILITLLIIASGNAVFSADMSTGRVSTEKVAILERLGEHVPLGVEFVDEEGKNVVLRDLVDKPTVLSLVYLSCRHACPMLLNGFAEVLGKTDLKAGKDFNVITVSFDENDTFEVAAEKKGNYIAAIGKPFPEKEWKFLTGTKENIEKLTQSVGFSFKREENGMFTHPVTLTILSSEGKVIRYLSGTTFLPFDLKMAVTEATEGRVGSVVRRAILYCFSYDPGGRRYVFNILRVVGIVTILVAASFVTFLIVTGKKERNKAR